ncbi:MAG: hypothetical protein ACREQZ_13655, partial [Woeseiaceae bacterium]
MRFAGLKRLGVSARDFVLKQVLRRNGKRALVREILWLQVLTTAVIGALAVAALYWGGQWVLQDNYGRWALQWTEDLNELGAPLYLSADNDAQLRIESFIAKYSEIRRVTYYEADGEALFSIANGEPDDGEAGVPNLGQARLQGASELAGSDTPYIMYSSLVNARAFEILAPVWTESIP